MSVVETNRKQLEAIGDYVTRANVNWFAVFPEKLAEFEQTAAENNRESHLIVYRTRSANKRDHYVIPISALTGLLTDDSLTHSDANGSIRWNVTLRDHILRVSHNHHSVDVSKYFELPLAIELDGEILRHSPRSVDLDPPATQRVASTVYRILRDTELTRKLKQDYEYRCQICGYSIELSDGTRYAEAHHIQPLGRPHCGPDCVENLIVVCPNHHAMCDYCAIKLVLTDLHVIVGHCIDPKFIAYHNDVVCSLQGDA
jgi:hypothetical protein